MARDVSSVLNSMRQSAPGPSGLRADHLLLAFRGGYADSLMRVLQSIMNGRAPRWLADARLLAIPKKDGGIRPIAVGEVLRRLASAALIRGSKSQLPPLGRQFILRRDGCLSVVSLVRASLMGDRSLCALTVDLRIAFNSVKRSAVLSAASGTMISAYAQWAYGKPSNLRFGQYVISSSSGVQQGDPAGPVLFSMALDSCLATARQTFSRDVLDLWYTDDGILLGVREEVIKTFDLLSEPLHFADLTINEEKCLL